MKSLIKVLIIISILFTVGCVTIPVNDSGCKQKYARHYDNEGHHTGTTWWTECD